MKTQINNKLSNMKMKIIYIMMALLIMPFTAMAQDIFSKYDGNPDVTYVSVKPKMFQILAKMDINTDDPGAQEYFEMVKSITSLKTIITGEENISADITSWVASRSRDLEELMEVKDDGTVVTLYIREGKEEDYVEELLILVKGLSNKMNDSDVKMNGKERKFETIVVSLTGNIDLNQFNFDLIGDQVALRQTSANIISNERMVFKDLKVYPNPSEDMLTIDLPSELKNDINITVLNSQGKQIQTQMINAENNTINVSNWQAGVYLIQVTHEDARIVKRFVKL
ncbi:DUF4252 domain-containing protein [Oceanihabitans sp.]|jgi:hypothetical protein|nr:DUF4252 domain-containing protein [Oceanihabitans sp.]